MPDTRYMAASMVLKLAQTWEGGQTDDDLAAT